MIRRGSYDASQAFEDAWGSREHTRSADPEVRELVHAAELICRSAVMTPSTDFRASLRERLMTEAATVLVDQPVEQRRPAPRARRRHGRRLAAVATALVASIGAVGMAASSASAVPGDLLYPVKRGVENVQMAMHRDDASRGEFKLQQARERLAEAQTLDHRQDAEHLASSLADFTSQARSGTDDLFKAYASDGSTATIDTVNTFVADASVKLASLSASVPADARSAFDNATNLVTGVASEASGLCATCTAADIGALVKTVQALASSTPKTESADEQAPAATATTPAPGLIAPITSGSSGGGSKPSGSTPTNGLGGALESTVDSLLGDDGLVPNLLGGLLGGGK